MGQIILAKILQVEIKNLFYRKLYFIYIRSKRKELLTLLLVAKSSNY